LIGRSPRPLQTEQDSGEYLR